MSTNVEFDENKPLKINQEKFLANSYNKMKLIDMLRAKLSENNIFSCQAEDDADSLIVETAINLKSTNVFIVSEDIDVLVLLTALAPDDHEIYFLKPSRGKSVQKFFSTLSLDKTFPKCKQHILFLHALTGCDTTSAFYNRGKMKFAKIFEEREDLQNAAKIFKSVEDNEQIIIDAGLKCILALYSSPKNIDNLNELRYNSFIKATAKSTCVQLASLSPTIDSASQHLKRVYLQVQMWLGRDISPEKWGWQFDSGLMKPIPMNQPPAPENLLQMLFCTCKSGCGTACGCRKSGLNCSVACVHCSGNSCSNPSPLVRIDEVDDE